MNKVECFFDCSSPWTFLGVHNLMQMAEKEGFEITWRPFLVGGVFNAVNPSMYLMRENPIPVKVQYLAKSIKDWSNQAGLNIKFPPSVFPVNSVKAMRACLWLQDSAQMMPFAMAVFHAYFTDDRDISSPDVLADLALKLGLDADAMLAGIGEQAIKDRLRDNTEELIKRDGFGSPTFFVNGDDMYFGNDALPLVLAALKA